MYSLGRIRPKDSQRTSSSGVIFSRENPSSREIHIDARRDNVFQLLIEDEMELSIRSVNCVKGAGIKSIGQLVQKSASELMKMKNFGSKSLQEIENALGEKGLTLGMTLESTDQNNDFEKENR